MAGLCRSIIENVFTKVIRISNLKTLGDKIVVQGGMFQNDAVLRALEQYIEKEVTRAPYLGIMGAIGVALITKERVQEKIKKDGMFEKTFLGLEKIDTFSYTQEANSICPFCTNHCKRTIVTFSNGNSWVTNNRCERGEIIGNPKDQAVREKVKQKTKKKEEIPNLYKIREQLTKYMEETFGISKKIVLQAIAVGHKAQRAFKSQLKKEGKKIIDMVKREEKYAVILASRPYQNDALVNHDLPDIFLSMGIPVLTADSAPGIEEIELGGSTLDIVNNYHARMLSSAIMAAQTEYLEYVQIVSFGCGHDAYLSDEIIRLMKEISGKTPLILKLDESDIKGSLQIRVRSFIETLSMRKKQGNVFGSS